MKALWVMSAGLALVVGCSLSNRSDILRPGVPVLDDTVSVTLGASKVTRDGAVRVSFLRKLEDSRCAIGVVCVWAGDVGAVLRVETIEVAGESPVHTAREPKQLRAGGYEVTLLDMTPYPGDKRQAPHVASVRVLRTGQ
jgi:hypothetical protein